MPIYLLATLDTKGPEAGLIRDRLLALGRGVRLVDCGSLGAATIPPDVPREEVFAAAGISPAAMLKQRDRGAAVTAAAEGAAGIVAAALARGEVDGVLGIGGSAGTTISAAAMRALPIGVPKLIVSTLASGDVRAYVGSKDIVMLSSVVDLAGVNRISRPILLEAAAAMAGMVAFRAQSAGRDEKPLIAATMFGVTTPCVEQAREILEGAGYEVLVFHATGSGGQTMESLIAEGLIAGVLDITTTELADELVGGVLSAGPERLTAAAGRGVPQVVSVGATDMVNFRAAESIPPLFAGRKLHRHNPTVTLMRTTPEENAAIGREIAEKVAASAAPACILLPLCGVSAIDREGEPFDDPAARESLFAAIRRHHGRAELMELDCHINDAAFAAAAAAKLLELMGKGVNLTERDSVRQS